jgi:hypothetical protein
VPCLKSQNYRRIRAYTDAQRHYWAKALPFFGISALDTTFLSRSMRHLIHTDRTIFKSVIPIMTFSMPSIFKVRMPPSTAMANSSATRARS